MKYLLDTNVFREIGKIAPHEHVARWLSGVDDADLAISVLTVREVCKGIAKLRSSNPAAASVIAERVTRVFDAFDRRIMPVDRGVAEVWGELLAVTEKHIDDAGLAATARSHGLALVTRYTKDFIPPQNPRADNPAQRGAR
jgi:predicted nucleic acid-binding protein